MRLNLQYKRKTKGLTQQEVADHIGINLRYYKAIETGDKLGAIWIWDKLEDLLNAHQRLLRENYPDTEDNQ